MASETEPATALDISALVDWMVDGAPTVRQPQDVLEELCRRLVDSGVSLHRVAVFVRTLHADIMGRRFLWRPGQPVSVSEAPFQVLTSDTYLRNPIPVVTGQAVTVRRCLADPDCANDFEVLEEFRRDGVTDYLVQPLTFTNGEVHAVSWTTRRPGGFTGAELDALGTVRVLLSRLAEIYALRRTAVTLLDTYVGRRSGERILRGQIRRGDIETIRAVIWMSDLRGFTQLSNTRPGAEVIGHLNAYFDCIVPAVEAQGGEVLKYIGDGVLAIFPIDGQHGTVADASRAALAAAGQAHAAAAGHDPPIRFRLVLHIGDVLYGNIGGPGRLDFTVIGPAVNLAARLEALAGSLDHDLLVSSTFAEASPVAAETVGQYPIRGFAEPQTVWTIPVDRLTGSAAAG